MQHHLLCTFTRLQEQQSVIISLNKKVKELESNVNQNTSALATAQSGSYTFII
jgi:hypothetical protein